MDEQFAGLGHKSPRGHNK